MKQTLQLGLFGFGCVGQGLYHVLHETKGVKGEIRKICVKDRSKPRNLPAHYFTYSRHELLADPAIDVIVELIDDAEAAFTILKEALSNGKAVVTANKRMIAEHLDEIVTLQELHGRPVLYEGAVCGSIPIIRNLEEYYDNDMIRRIEGIFNGSTNYILTRVSEDGMTYSDALRKAQDLGFAETDPRLDVEACDPAFKLSILISHAFGLIVRPEKIVRFGINRVSSLDLKFARERNLSIKLVARAVRSGDKVFALVAPQYVGVGNPLHAIRNEFNAVIVEGAFAEEQLFSGKGAGGCPTASAVLSDISALRYDYRYEYKKVIQQEGFTLADDAWVEAVVSFPEGSTLPTGSFVRVKGGFRSGNQQYIQGIVSLSQIRKWHSSGGISVILGENALLKPVGTTETQFDQAKVDTVRQRVEIFA